MVKTLWHLIKGEQCSIEGFKPGLDEHYCRRLAELGFLPGALVTCMLSPKLGAPKLYSLDDRIANFVDVRVNR